ncbi:MAG: DUF1499 domain-containing protein, partial [Methylococcales bacterium]|nr:DUF1499 domain-containing protein [Methylococcales bacterium]
FCHFPHIAYADMDKQLIEGKLAVCPDKPNCVNTEYADLAPISYAKLRADQAWNTLQVIIKAQGGEIKKVEQSYLWATFTSSLFKFTDDVEARLETENKRIHLRSASRVGYYDFNANKKRLQKIIEEATSKID